jgi:hypothetical protein
MVTIQRTISDLEGDRKMTERDIFSGFDEKKYQMEAEARWGDSPQYRQSQRQWASYSEEKQAEIKELGGEITRRMVSEDTEVKPDDPEVQAAIQEYYQYLNEYFYSCEVEFLRNLADMWVEDQRFAVNYERVREGGAKFVREAVHYFCDQRAKQEE